MGFKVNDSSSTTAQSADASVPVAKQPVAGQSVIGPSDDTPPDVDAPEQVPSTPWTEKKKLGASDIDGSGTPAAYPAHLEAVFEARPDLKVRWNRLHAWLKDPQQDAVASAKYEVVESINEDHDLPKLDVMLSFLIGQLGKDGLQAFVSDTVKRLAEVSSKQDARTLLAQWPAARWGELPDRATLAAIAAE